MYADCLISPRLELIDITLSFWGCVADFLAPGHIIAQHPALHDIIQHDIKGGQFYEYIGPLHVAAPPVGVADMELGILFGHKLNVGDDHYEAIWTVIRNNGVKEWAKCREFGPHPNQDKVAYRQKVLVLRQGRRPAWIDRKLAIDSKRRALAAN